jgi:hypothetical protein
VKVVAWLSFCGAWGWFIPAWFGHKLEALDCSASTGVRIGYVVGLLTGAALLLGQRVVWP